MNQELSHRKKHLSKLIKQLSWLDRFFHFWDLKKLSSILLPTEDVLALVLGKYQKKIGILAATNTRVVFVHADFNPFFKDYTSNLVIKGIPYEKVASIQEKMGLLGGEIMISSNSGDSILVKHIYRNKFRDFVDKLYSLMKSSKQKHKGQEETRMSVSEQLIKLATLKEKGLLTEEEFVQAKKKILDKNNSDS